MRPLAAQRGFTLFEITIGFALFTGLIALLGSVYASSDGLARQCMATMSANEEHRRNLDALANLCRAAPTNKFSGFDAANTSTAPSFQCVTGVNAAGLVFGPVQTLSWRANQDKATGVATGESSITTTGDGSCQPLVVFNARDAIRRKSSVPMSIGVGAV
jgi:type II secretory pathway pseudopilin PulG